MNDDDDFPNDPDTCQHDWSEWKLGPLFNREERFCDLCGSMEWQSIEGLEPGSLHVEIAQKLHDVKYPPADPPEEQP